MSGLAQWLAGGLPVRRADEVQVAEDSPRRKGIRRAAKIMFFSGVLFVVCLVFSLAIDEPAPLIPPLALFFIALVMMLYARLFSPKSAAGTQTYIPVIQTPLVQTPALGVNPTQASLPPATNLARPPIGRQQVRTNELAQPASVTENTTRLLDE